MFFLRSFDGQISRSNTLPEKYPNHSGLHIGSSFASGHSIHDFNSNNQYQSRGRLMVNLAQNSTPYSNMYDNRF